MKKVLILAAAISLAGGGAALASSSSWFGSSNGSHSASNGIGNGYAYGKNRGDCFFNKGRGGRGCGNGGQNGGGNNGGGNGTVPSDVPVPAAGFLLLAGLGAFAVAKRRQK